MAMADPIPVKAVSRRSGLQGIAGTAGLVAVPAIIAACGPAGATSATGESAAASEAASAAPSAAASAVATGSISFGSNDSDEVPKAAMQQMVDAFTHGDRRPITSALNNLQGAFFTDINVLAPGALLAAISTIQVFLALQRQFISGLSLGSTKG
jgi:hypothetical protein